VTKRLRVLTGRHAGASQDLFIGSHTVGSTDDSQILITDWSPGQPGIALELAADGGAGSLVWVVLDAGGDGAAKRRHVLHDLRPVRFGDIVLCAGPVSPDWPADAALLRRVFGPASMIKRAASRHRVLLCGLSAFAGLVAVISVVGYSSPAESAPKVLSPQERAEQIELRAQALGIGGVVVSEDGGHIVVAGLLEDDQQVRKLHAAIQRSGEARHVSHQYTSAAQISSMIQGALGEADVTVVHKGQGAFQIEGRVRSLDALRHKVVNLADDLRASVRRIDVAAVELPATGAVRPSAVLSDDTDSYVQTAEGIKHLGLLAPVSGAAAPRMAPLASAAARRTSQEQP
jgi:type III secretion protein D